MPLTDAAIRKAKPANKPQKLRNGNGLYLQWQWLYLLTTGWPTKYKCAAVLQ